ncbi:MAG: TadE family protein [Anaerolineales bacterium]
MSTSKNPISAQRGQSLVELGLTLIIMLTLLAGAVDFGSAFFTYIALQDAAQEGALYGSVAPIIDSNGNGRYDAGEPLNTTAIESRVRSTSSNPVNLSTVNVLVTISSTRCTGGTVTVKVSYTYQLTMPLIGAIIGRQTIPLSASVTDTILIPSCP